MFLLGIGESTCVTSAAVFSSPIFGDMFLLLNLELAETLEDLGFRLLYSEICSYYHSISQFKFCLEVVFVSYIRRYVLTGCPQLKGFCSLKVFVSYIRRYVLTVLRI